MYRLRFVSLACLTAGLLVFAAAAPTRGAGVKVKTNKEKIVGKWEVIKGPKPLPLGLKLTVEFTKDGKCHATHTSDGQTKSKEGAWKVDGDKLTITPKDKNEKPETLTIKMLDAKRLIILEHGKEVELKKIK